MSGRSLVVAWVLVACRGAAESKPDQPGGSSTPSSSPDDTPADTSQPTDPGPDDTALLDTSTAPRDTGEPRPETGGSETGGLDDTGLPPDTGSPGCLPDPAQAVLAAVMTPGPIATQVVLDLELAVPAPAAVLCAADDGSEEHLLEGLAPQLAHTFEVSGLRPSTAYTCRLAPTCPTVDTPAVVSFATPRAPNGLPNLRVERHPSRGTAEEWTLAPYKDGACAFSKPTWMLAWDRDGVLRWWQELPNGVGLDVEALWHPDEQVVIWGGGLASQGRVRKVDLFGRQVYAAELPDWESKRYHHDAKALPSGALLTLEERTNFRGGQTWLGFGLQVHDPGTGALLYDFDSQVLVERGELRTAGGFLDQDPYHANWMDWIEHAAGPALYVSLCFDQSILRLDPTTDALLWRVARNEGWTVQDGSGAPLPQAALPQCQHGLEVLDEDRLLVYDNGRDRDFSSASEWTFDGATRTATRHWIWTEPDWHEGTLGDIDRLGPDRVWVTQAHPECWSETRGDVTSLVEVEPSSGEVVLRQSFPRVDDVAYRSHRYEGCALFHRVDACPDRARRREALRSVGL